MQTRAVVYIVIYLTVVVVAIIILVPRTILIVSSICAVDVAIIIFISILRVLLTAGQLYIGRRYKSSIVVILILNLSRFGNSSTETISKVRSDVLESAV